MIGDEVERWLQDGDGLTVYLDLQDIVIALEKAAIAFADTLGRIAKAISDLERAMDKDDI